MVFCGASGTIHSKPSKVLDGFTVILIVCVLVNWFVSNIGIYQQKFIGLITNGDYVPIIQFRDVLAHAAAVSPEQ